MDIKLLIQSAMAVQAQLKGVESYNYDEDLDAKSADEEGYEINVPHGAGASMELRAGRGFSVSQCVHEREKVVVSLFNDGGSYWEKKFDASDILGAVAYGSEECLQ